MKEQEKGPTGAETLRGGTKITVEIDAKPGEQPFHEIPIRQLKIKEMPAMMEAQGDEIALAALFTGKDKAFVESLTNFSHEAVIAEGNRVNADFFVRWVQRRMQTQERIMPGATSRIMEAATKAGAAPSASPTGLQRRPADAPSR
jgi:hypothetical protein